MFPTRRGCTAAVQATYMCIYTTEQALRMCFGLLLSGRCMKDVLEILLHSARLVLN